MSIFKLIKGGKAPVDETADTTDVVQPEPAYHKRGTFPDLPKGLPSLSDPLSDLGEARQAVEDLWVFLDKLDPTTMLDPIKEKRPRSALETVKVIKWAHELREKVQEWKQELQTLDEVIGVKQSGGR